MQFHDYYQTLGVDKKASQADIKKAYRKLSKQYHPDRNDAAGAEDRFKEVNEAYEVLGDPDKRKRYDSVGSGFSAGDKWQPPPGWQNVEFNFENMGFGGGPGFSGFGGGGGAGGAPVGGFSDFFETLFGAAAQGQRGGQGARRRPAYEPGRPRKGKSHEVELTISLEDAYHGVTKTIELDRTQHAPDGGRRTQKKSYTVKIPAGTTHGTKIRLAGQGQEGLGGGKAGDLLLKVKIAKHDRFEVVHGHNLLARLSITPWEAALGAKVPLVTLDGEVKLTIPPGAQSGKKLRLKEKGLPKKKGPRGDLEVELLVKVPKELSDEERALYEKLRDVSEFDPR
jgi:curved DNA-binding protein